MVPNKMTEMESFRMKKQNFGLGMVGFGGMANWHRELIESGIEGLRLIGVYDIKPERNQAAVDLGYKAYDSLDALLADPDIDIVLCATPNDCHRDITVRALRAGKNVVCEKPATLSTADLQVMIDTANETGNLFVVHQNRRWDEDYRTMKKVFEQKVLGDVFEIQSRVQGSRGIPGDWRGMKKHGGGMIYDWGVHLIDQLLNMVDEKIKTVYCTVEHVTNYEVDDGFRLILTFESGLRALIEVGTSHFIVLPRWYMLGENGSAQIDDWDFTGDNGCKIISVTNWDKNDAVPVRTAAGLTKTMAPRTDDTIARSRFPMETPDIKDFYRNVMAAIRGDEEILITHAQLMRVLKVMETAFRSAEVGQVLDFE